MSVDTQVDRLVNAINNGENSMLNPMSGIIRTMVFANTVEAVEAIANILTRAGIECYRYHRDSSLEERTKNLVDFQQKGGVFVCTDAAARGLDIPNVSHVIQVNSNFSGSMLSVADSGICGSGNGSGRTIYICLKF